MVTFSCCDSGHSRPTSTIDIQDHHFAETAVCTKMKAAWQWANHSNDAMHRLTSAKSQPDPNTTTTTPLSLSHPPYSSCVRTRGCARNTILCLCTPLCTVYVLYSLYAFFLSFFFIVKCGVFTHMFEILRYGDNRNYYY